MKETHESVTMEDDSSASSETTQTADKDRYKRDMLRWKEKSSELENRLKEIEMQDQERKGNLEQVIANLKDENKKVKADLLQDRYKFANARIDEAVKMEAIKRKLPEDAAELLVSTLKKEDKGVIELTDDFNPNVDDVKSIVDRQMERYSNVFKKNIKMVDGVPSTGKPERTKAFDPKTATPQQLREHILKNYNN